MRLRLLVICLLMILSIFSRCNQPRENKPVGVSMIDSTKSITDNLQSFDSYAPQYRNWLSERTLEKPIQVYLTILKNAYGDSHLNKKAFEETINACKIYPLSDTYIYAKSGDFPFFALFSLQDSLIAFKSEELGNENSGNSYAYVDSLYVQDWNKDGHLDFLVRKYGRISGGKFLDVDVYDFNISKNQFIRTLGYNYSSQDLRKEAIVLEKWADKIVFLKPDSIQLVTRHWNEPQVLKRSDWADEETYRNKIKAQKAYLATPLDEPIKRQYFHLDTVSKRFMRIKG